MSALAWLAIPLVALLLAVLWVLWASRPKPPADVHDTLEEHQRFKAAFDPDRQHLDRQHPDRRRSHRDRRHGSQPDRRRG